MNETIKLTETLERALRMAQSSHVGSLLDNVHGNTINALVRRGLLEKVMKDLSGWTGIGYHITEAGTRYLKELDGMGGGSLEDQIDAEMDKQMQFARETKGLQGIIDEPRDIDADTEFWKHVKDFHQEYGLMTPDYDLNEYVKTLRESRERHAELKAEYEAELAKHPELAQLAERVKAGKEAEQLAYQALAGAATEIFEASGDKQPHPHVKVKVHTAYDYNYDRAEVWAMNEARYMLTLDVKQFENALKSGLKLDFVTISEQPKAYIDKDLS